LEDGLNLYVYVTFGKKEILVGTPLWFLVALNLGKATKMKGQKTRKKSWRRVVDLPVANGVSSGVWKFMYDVHRQFHKKKLKGAI